MTTEQLETRLQGLENKDLGKSAGSTKGKPKIEVYDKDRKKGAGALITPAKVKQFHGSVCLKKIIKNLDDAWSRLNTW